MKLFFLLWFNMIQPNLKEGVTEESSERSVVVYISLIEHNARVLDRPAPPGKPELLPESEGTPDLVTLRWSRPINDGGSPVSGYLVEHRRVGSPHWVRATPLPVPFPEITLSGLEPGWRYQFRVSAENAVGYSDPSETSEQITVTFQRSAVTAPKFTQEVKDTVALENDKCEFVAHFLGQPAPKVCWFKDGFEIFSSRRIRILTEHDRSILTIHQTSLSDEGEIKCTATNRAGHVSTRAKLTVEAPPSIRLPRNYEDGLLFEIGEVIRLKVSVVGRPTPLVFWSHNGESIQENGRYEIGYSDKSVSIKIAEARRQDRGEYQIKAVNKLGEDNASFLVTVTDKPSPPGKARVVMTLGRSVTLSWTSPEDDGGCKIGNYIIEYYRLGWNVWLKAATCRQLTTRLGDLIEGSEYKFRIKAESPYGVSDPSEESEIIFIPDPKRGLTHPSPRGRNEERDFFEKPIQAEHGKKSKQPRSQSSSRVEIPSTKVSDINASINSAGIPPIRPKRTKSKSQQHTPESTPVVQRRGTDHQINRTIFDRESLSRDLAYGSPDFKVKKGLDTPQKKVICSSTSYALSDLSKSPSPEPKTSPTNNTNVDSAPNDVLRSSSIHQKQQQVVPSQEARKRLIREHSATVSGSSEFMLVLYSDENERDHSDMFKFDENSVPPPLSLSAPELGNIEPPSFALLKYSASSSELLHERAMMRFYLAAEAEDRELEKIRRENHEKNLSLDIPKIQINSEESEDIGGPARKHSLRRKMSSGSLTQQQAKWAQRRHSLKNTSELKQEILPNNLKKTPVTVDMKRDLLGNELSFEESEREQSVSDKIVYTQDSFERKPITLGEEMKWQEDYEESLSESESESESEYERFKYEVSRNRKVHLGKSFDEEVDTYRPPGGLRGMIDVNKEPFEILNKPKTLPDPNFIPKPILKKVDSPSVSPKISPHISPVISPPLSPTKTARALSPRPDVVLQRNRSKSLAVPVLSTLISNSSGEESDEPKVPRKRSLSITSTHSVSPEQKTKPKYAMSPITSSIVTAAQITGITAASVVIPEKLLDKKREEEAVKVVADHYDDIVKTVVQRRKSNPQINFDRPTAEKSRYSFNTSQEDNLSIKDKTPSKENLSQDSGYQSVSGYRKSSLTDHFDSNQFDKSPVRTFALEKNAGDVYNINSNADDSHENLGNPEYFHRWGRREQNIGSFSKQTTDGSYAKNRPVIETSKPISKLDSSQKSNISTFQQHESRKTSPSRKGRRSVVRSTSPSRRGTSVSSRSIGMSPFRQEHKGTLQSSEKQDTPLRVSPIKKKLETENISRSPPPNPTPKRKPMLREIMTQTSGFLESFSTEYFPERTRQEQLLAHAEIKVRSAVDWLTDLAMFAVACWLYLFKNELLAIPILLIMVYRQLKEEIKRIIPDWVAKRLRKKTKEQ